MQLAATTVQSGFTGPTRNNSANCESLVRRRLPLVAYVVKDTGTGMGLGIFAAQDIPKGTMLWKYEPGKSVKLYSKSTIGARLKGLSKKEVVEFLEHVYGWDGHVVEILDDGKYWNHSAKPNTGGPADSDHSFAIRDIKKGEELLDNYGTYEKVEWFEQLCAKFGVVHYDESWQ